jgi:hypothetical protein
MPKYPSEWSLSEGRRPGRRRRRMIALRKLAQEEPIRIVSVHCRRIKIRCPQRGAERRSHTEHNQHRELADHRSLVTSNLKNALRLYTLIPLYRIQILPEEILSGGCRRDSGFIFLPAVGPKQVTRDLELQGQKAVLRSFLVQRISENNIALSRSHTTFVVAWRSCTEMPPAHHKALSTTLPQANHTN